MVNEEKVALMTKLALYEQGEGKTGLPMSKYYHSDYMALRLINSVIVTTLVYIMAIALIVLVNVEALLEELVTMDLQQTGKNLLIAYLVVIAVNIVITYAVGNYRFKKYRKGLNEYNGNLKKLYYFGKDKKTR